MRGATGERIRAGSPPRRIVALTPALAEQVYALGCGRRLVGVTIRSTHPPAAAHRPCVGNLHRPDLSAIVALRPDLVVASRELNRKETVAALRARGLRVFVFPAYSTCGEVLGGFHRLARLLGCSGDAKRLVAKTARVLRTRRGRRTRVFLQVWTAPLMGAAPGSYLHDLLWRCGGENVLVGRRGRVVVCSEKEVVRGAPDVILITLRNAAPEIERWRHYPELPAVQHRRIHVIPAYWVTPSPDALCRGARELRRLLAVR